jgi:hypothetical protein
MFSLCEGMKWAHLPNEGGIYNQSPQLLDDFMVIWEIKGEHEKKRQAKEQAEMKRQQSAAKSGRRG